MEEGIEWINGDWKKKSIDDETMRNETKTNSYKLHIVLDEKKWLLFTFMCSCHISFSHDKSF